MRVVIGMGDGAVTRAMAHAFGDDEVTTVDLASLEEPQAVSAVEQLRPGAVVCVPDWTRDDAAHVRGTWWLARASDLVGVPIVLLSSAEVFDGADPRPRDEIDEPSPASGPGRAARTAELLVTESTRLAVIVRVGPMDVGALAAPQLIGHADGIVGGGSATISSLRAAHVGVALRDLAVGRRCGTWHLEGQTSSLADLAEHLGMATPAHGDVHPPPPLRATKAHLCGLPAPPPWPPPATAESGTVAS